MLACANFREAKVHMADLLEESAGQEVSCQGSSLLSEVDGGEKSEDLHGSDILEKSNNGRNSESNKNSDWREPIITYLQDPSRKTDKAVRRLALKYTLVDDDLYRRTADGLLLKCLAGDQAELPWERYMMV